MNRWVSAWRGPVTLGLLGVAALVAAPSSLPASASVPPPPVTVTPGGALHDGQNITISVPANSYFTPHARINVLECADPGGTTANLPRDDSTCDGNTVQGNSVLVAKGGSFTVSGYTVYALPSASLGEQANFQPVCNARHACVLFVGQDQNSFTEPHAFSAPFTFPATTGTGTTTTSVPSATTPAANSGADAATVGAAGTTSTTTTGATGAGAAAAPPPLAFTGAPAGLKWLVGAGLLLMAAGALGRRRVVRGVR